MGASENRGTLLFFLGGEGGPLRGFYSTKRNTHVLKPAKVISAAFVLRTVEKRRCAKEKQVISPNQGPFYCPERNICLDPT